MTPAQLRAARIRLGLSQEEMGTMLGYEGEGQARKQIVYQLETGRLRIREPQRRLMELYLAGCRPPDWPGS